MWFLSFSCMHFSIQSFNRLAVSICCVLEMHRGLWSLLRSSRTSKKDRNGKCYGRGKQEELWDFKPA